MLESIAAESPMLAAMLSEARPTALAEQDLTLAWPESASFSKRQAEEPAKRELIANSIRDLYFARLVDFRALVRDREELGRHYAAAAAAMAAGDGEVAEQIVAALGVEAREGAEPVIE